MTESTAGTGGSSSRLTWRLIHRQSSHSRLHPYRCLHSHRAIQRLRRKCRATSPREIWNQRRFPYQFPLLPDQGESSASRSVSATKDVRTGGQEEPHYKANEELIKDKEQKNIPGYLFHFLSYAYCFMFHINCAFMFTFFTMIILFTFSFKLIWPII